jgi:hypothetical protein
MIQKYFPLWKTCFGRVLSMANTGINKEWAQLDFESIYN